MAFDVSAGYSLPDFVHEIYESILPDREQRIFEDSKDRCESTLDIVRRIRDDAVEQRGRLAEDFLLLREGQQTLLNQYPLYTTSDTLPLDRYKDVVPYAHTRVVLKTRLHDYINASWIRDTRQADPTRCPDEIVPSYIACQGPLKHTSEAFWLMVVEQQVSTVVMLTGLKEHGREKCHGYFPRRNGNEGSHVLEFERVRVTCIQDRPLDGHGIVERDLSVIVRGHEAAPAWSVKHYQLQAWPDHGVPDSPRAVYGIMDVLYRCHMHGKKDGAPVVVHCSAGIGRTGVVLVLDILRRRITQLVRRGAYDVHETINIKSIVQCIREQRAGMVQTVSQMKFCIDTLVDMCDMILLQASS